MSQKGAPLVVKNLTRSYGEFRAVDGLSISARKGELLTLLGPNGAGKTTLMRMLAGLLKPDGGTIEIMGASGASLRSIQRNHIGYCPQRLIIWRDLTCTEQLIFAADMFRIPRTEGKKRAAGLLGLFGLAEKADELAAHLSGGMQRRLSIALSMIHNPDIYILDEPAAGLDPQSRVLVRDRIRALGKEDEKTVIVSTHDMEEADRLADRVAIIDRGKLKALSTPAELKNMHGTSNLIEIDLKGTEAGQIDRAFKALCELHPNTRLADEFVVIDVDEGQELMRPIRTVLGRLGAEPREIRFRRRSLEDVFIELTGRRLRE